MPQKGIQIDTMPFEKAHILIAGFDGWGNAMDVSKAMVSYLIRKLKAKPFATINSDLFYRYDENRPVVVIEGGVLNDVVLPAVPSTQPNACPKDRTS